MPIPTSDLAESKLDEAEDGAVELETLPLHSPRAPKNGFPHIIGEKHSHITNGEAESQDNHDHDHKDDDAYDGHDHHHHHEHDHGENSGCTGHSHGKGWMKYLPHAHGLEHRLANDRKALIQAGFILFIAVAGQLIAGGVAHSSVLIVEAVHSTLDGFNVLLALLSVHLAARKPTTRMSYGYGRAEILSALVSVLGLGLLCFKLTIGAVERLWHWSRGTKAKIHVEGNVVFIAEAITLAANIIMTYVLSRNQSSLNIRALRAHVMADCVENVVVLFAGLLMWIMPQLSVIDPILTLVIVCVLVVLNSRIAWEAVSILMQATPEFIDVENAAAEMRGVPGVSALGPLHVWTLTSGTVVATAVARVDTTLDQSRRDIRLSFNEILKKHGVTVAMVELKGGEEGSLAMSFSKESEDESDEELHKHYNPLVEEDVV